MEIETMTVNKLTFKDLLYRAGQMQEAIRTWKHITYTSLHLLESDDDPPKAIGIRLKINVRGSMKLGDMRDKVEEEADLRTGDGMTIEVDTEYFSGWGIATPTSRVLVDVKPE